MVRKLFEVTDGGALYWVSAVDWPEAFKLVRGIDDFEEDESFGLQFMELDAVSAGDRTFAFGDGNTCSLWNAFELVSSHSEIIGCSEWP